MRNASGYNIFRQRQAELAMEQQMTPSEALREALSIDLSEFEHKRTPFMDWALRVPEPKAGKLDFDRFPFQVELYKEAAADKEAVVKKATQVGVSAYLVRWTLYWADTKGLVALYVFPTRDHVYDFSDQRMKPAIDGSEYLRSRISPGDVQNKGLKKIGLGFVYFRGSETKRGLDSVDADVLALDEYDTLTQGNIGDAERRISGSLTGLIRRVGVPSIADFGISREYDKTDQRRWIIKCPSCNTHQPMRFKENVVLDDGKGTAAYRAAWDVEKRYFIGCEKCRKPLDVTTGQWVATYNERSVRGYHIPRLIVASADLNMIVRDSKSKEPYKLKVHHNKDLAESYEVAGGRLSRQEIAAAQRDYPMMNAYRTDNLVTMGVDVASARALNVRISEHLSDGTKRGLWIGTVDYFGGEADVPAEELSLDKLMVAFGVNMACIDHMPEQRSARAFAERFPGRVYLARYAPPEADQVVKIDEELGVIAVKRVQAIDTVIAQVRSQRNLLPKELPPEYVENMVAVVRNVERDEFDKVKVFYESTDADDYLHAEVYDVFAKEAWNIRQAVHDALAAEQEMTTAEAEGFEFNRSSLGDYGQDDSYSSGFDSDDYSSGF